MLVVSPQVLVPESELSLAKLRSIERYARICYKSEDRMDNDYNPRFLGSIIARGHESVIEHEKVTVMFVVDRGITHEIVRHRIGSYSQESTRYCNYSNNKFGNEISVIKPYFWENNEAAYEEWYKACLQAEASYFALLDMGSSPQEARSVLPTCLKTEIAVTFNLREWRHFFALRCSAAAHPQMREVAIPLLLLFKERLPIFFEDIDYDENFPMEHYAEILLTDSIFNL